MSVVLFTTVLVQYGRFDLHRLVTTTTAIPGVQGGRPRIGIEYGGWHAADGAGALLHVYQVYFHKTRVAYDIHLREATKTLLPGGHFPNPAPSELDGFLAWDDWRVLGLLAGGEGGEHGKRLARRQHYRMNYQTDEVQTDTDRTKLARVREVLAELIAAEIPAGKSLYKKDDTDIAVYRTVGWQRTVAPLSDYSNVARNLGKTTRS